MNTKISLPKISRKPGTQAHPYPWQIGMQAQRFLQGAIFYPAFVDMVVGQYFNEKKEDGYKTVRDKFIQAGLGVDNWEISWSCFEEYLNIFPNPVYQGTIFAMKSHWDWYISSLASFIQFARTQVAKSPSLSRVQQAKLIRLDFEPFRKQFELLDLACGIVLAVDENTLTSLEELNLVRNLGIHSLWEVDEFYISKSKTIGWDVGEIRTITFEELEDWHNCLQKVIRETYTSIAKQYATVPDFPHLDAPSLTV